MSDSWDEYADGWDTDEDVISYSDKAFQSLTGVIDIVGLNILDFGCGTGLLTEKMSVKANEILAVDSSEKMTSVLINKKLPNVTTLSSIVSESNLKTNSLFHKKFDLIVASSDCAFVPDYEGTLGLLKTLLEPKGIFVQWDWLELESDPGFGFSKGGIESAFKKTGFEVKSVREVFTLDSKKGSMKVIMGVAQNT